MDFPSPAVQHTHVNIGTTEDPLALPFRTNARHAKKMPLLFFFPYIIWMGMWELAQEEMRVPIKVTPVRR